MSDSVYRVMEVIGSSSESWEKAARNAVEKAGIHREDLRYRGGRRVRYEDRGQGDRRVPHEVKVSFKYHEMV